MTAKLLIIDDEALFREDLAELLRRRDYDCVTAPDGDQGLEILPSFEPDIVLCDVVMPGKSGLELLDDIARLSPETPVIMLTAFGDLQSAVEAFRKGVADYITKPLVIEDVLQKIERLINYKRLSQEVKLLRRELSRDVDNLSVVCHSEPMKRVLELAEKVASTRSTVLITGKSGTGKEVIARAIHSMGASKDAHGDGTEGMPPFVPINCAGIPLELLESELFGHVKGAFTGAVKDRVGHFELAGSGTILLDEIADMPMSLQSKLLRVLEEKEFVRVGGSRTIPLRARIVAATNKKLKELVELKEFREDLYFRLAVFEITIPPLRDRRSDIPALTEYFVRLLNQEMKRDCKGVDGDAMGNLLAHEWPGNVRELRNVIERAMILYQGEYISAAELPAELRGTTVPDRSTDNLREVTRGYEAMHIKRVLRDAQWNKEEAARRLGINPSTLYRKMTDLGVPHQESSQTT